MRFSLSLLVLVSIFFSGLFSGCGGSGRILIVRSEPPESEVCIKGRADSEYFANEKSCVGTTPFEAKKVKVNDPDGHKHDVSFKDVEGDKENFYVIVSRPGYVSQVIEIPKKGWEHNVTLRSEAASLQSQLLQSSQPGAAPVTAVGTVRVTSDPAGALVYVNGALKGNTPFTFEGGTSDSLMVKLELEGYKPIEKNLMIEGGKALSVNFTLAKVASTAESTSTPQAAVPAQPVQPVKQGEVGSVPLAADAVDAADAERVAKEQAERMAKKPAPAKVAPAKTAPATR